MPSSSFFHYYQKGYLTVLVSLNNFHFVSTTKTNFLPSIFLRVLSHINISNSKSILVGNCQPWFSKGSELVQNPQVGIERTESHNPAITATSILQMISERRLYPERKLKKCLANTLNPKWDILWYLQNIKWRDFSENAFCPLIYEHIFLLQDAMDGIISTAVILCPSQCINACFFITIYQYKVYGVLMVLDIKPLSKINQNNVSTLMGQIQVWTPALHLFETAQFLSWTAVQDVRWLQKFWWFLSFYMRWLL